MCAVCRLYVWSFNLLVSRKHAPSSVLWSPSTLIAISPFCIVNKGWIGNGDGKDCVSVRQSQWNRYNCHEICLIYSNAIRWRNFSKSNLYYLNCCYNFSRIYCQLISIISLKAYNLSVRLDEWIRIPPCLSAFTNTIGRVHFICCWRIN